MRPIRAISDRSSPGRALKPDTSSDHTRVNLPAGQIRHTLKRGDVRMCHTLLAGSVTTVLAMSRLRVASMAVSVVLLGSLVVACDGSSDSDTTTALSGTPGPSSTAAATTTTIGASSTTSTTSQSVTTSTQPPSGPTVQVAFSFASDECEGAVAIVDRVIADGDDPLVSAFEFLVAGPTSGEKTDGYSSWFSAKTAGTVRSVELHDGLLVVDFDNFIETIANAGTSCGSVSLLAELNGTAFQFADVDAVTYEIEGSCETFFNWLQRGCVIYPRP